MTICLVLGGTRSGKSAFAERVALAHQGDLLYLATGSATDDDMAARIDRHRAGRDKRFTTVEAGADLAAALAVAPPRPALVDSLGTWVASRPRFPDLASFEQDLAELMAALVVREAPTIVVSDEVGLGVHPSTEVGRHFRDLVGLANQMVASVAEDVWLVVAGRPLRLPPEGP
jgi:adenosyl cobinamide kinase/adenosyl cobinamide phosphate guanylyltransferase